MFGFQLGKVLKKAFSTGWVFNCHYPNIGFNIENLRMWVSTKNSLNFTKQIERFLISI